VERSPEEGLGREPKRLRPVYRQASRADRTPIFIAGSIHLVRFVSLCINKIKAIAPKKVIKANFLLDSVFYFVFMVARNR
jgi:hypothetical protein